jgi:hypothetical protein
MTYIDVPGSPSLMTTLPSSCVSTSISPMMAVRSSSASISKRGLFGTLRSKMGSFLPGSWAAFGSCSRAFSAFLRTAMACTVSPLSS